MGIDAALLTMEMSDVRGGPGSGAFTPISADFYSVSGTFANVQGLNPGREYRFRLAFERPGDMPLHSEFVSVRTHKEYRGGGEQQQQQQQGSQQQQQSSFQGGNFQQQQQQQPLQTPQQLQRLFESPESVEIGWKYSEHLADHVSFVVEASAAPPNQLSAAVNDGSLLPGSCLPQLSEPWRICYRGQATNCTVHDSR
jgi:hypothetical protein